MTDERKTKMLTVLSRRQQNITVVMENIFDPHNVFAIMRTCDAIGIQDVYIIGTEMPRRKKAGKSSSHGASYWVTMHGFDNAAECIAELRNHYSNTYHQTWGKCSEPV